MPLSEHEQRLLEEIEKALKEDGERTPNPFTRRIIWIGGVVVNGLKHSASWRQWFRALVVIAVAWTLLLVCIVMTFWTP
jgi:hypothetical protein